MAQSSAAQVGTPENKKRVKYQTKTIKFGNKEMTLYSIDGVTWSSRRDELVQIMERHEQERLKLLQNMGEAKAEEEREAAGSKDTTYSESGEEGPIVIDDDSSNEEEEGKAKANVKANARDKRPIQDLPKKQKEVESNAKGSKKKQPSARDRVKFISPKPRQLEKARKKAAKSVKKKKAA